MEEITRTTLGRRSKKNQERPAPPNSSGVGFLLLDGSFELIYANDEAAQILVYPTDPREIRSLDGFLAKQIQSVLFNSHSSPQSSPSTEFLSGRRHYRCRALPVESHTRNPARATAVLLERASRESIDVVQVAADFNLTKRERETLGFLLEGLTNKKIAQHMQISPNTVKGFTRLVMIKMNVSTRSAVIGKILKEHVLR